MLYPLKFTPILKEKIWGGERLKTLLNHDIGTMKQCGESWEVSGIVGDESEVANGFLAENNLNELLEVYLTDLVGEKNYEQYGLGFPLLIKYIDAHDNLSVQVHPDDELAKKKYGQNGKTEMWH
ncbi:MAG: mannose-6-phosphate isomerase, partial [Bacteroidales bacterium]|nr:mannose-6-phosphate isomerase [Bacteroidales bacterium]